MKSMTGYGRSEIIENNSKISVEIKTVNNRFLDINCRMPKSLLFLEESVRNEIKGSLARGRVDVYIGYESLDDSERAIKVDLGLVSSYMKAVGQICEKAGIDNDISIDTLLRIPDVISFEEKDLDEEQVKGTLIKAVKCALDELVEARSVEGVRMVADLLGRIEILRDLLNKIEVREPLVVEEYRVRLKEKITEYLEDTEIDENRFNNEMLYFIDRASITEEIVRLKSHFDQAESILRSDAAQGRNLDFLVQEMNREFNTIASKSLDIEITNCVLTAKSEVEKIREQIKNIE